MADEERTIEHESFGLLSFSRTQSNKADHLFGSSIKHQNTIVMRVHRASEHRSLYRFNHFEKEGLIEVELSYSQFAEAITAMNTQGIPCTIKRVLGQQMEKCPGESQRELFEKEFEGKVSSIANMLVSLESSSNEILDRKGGLKVADKKELKGLIFKLVQEVRANIPFIQSSFNEAMDKTTMEAKVELEAFMTHQIVSLGIQEFKKQFEITDDEKTTGKAITFKNG